MTRKKYVYNVVKINVRFTPEQAEEINKEAKRCFISIMDLTRYVMGDYSDKLRKRNEEEQKFRELRETKYKHELNLQSELLNQEVKHK